MEGTTITWNKKELDRITKNLFYSEIRKAIRIGNQVNKKMRVSITKEWFLPSRKNNDTGGHWTHWRDENTWGKGFELPSRKFRFDDDGNEYEVFSHSSFINSLVYEYGFHVSKGVATIEFNSYVLKEKYPIRETRLWQQNNGGRRKGPYGGNASDAFNFIVKELQWEQGIIGLPKNSSRSDWVNKHFIQRPASLKNYTESRYKYSWSKQFNSAYKNITGG